MKTRNKRKKQKRKSRGGLLGVKSWKTSGRPRWQQLLGLDNNYSNCIHNYDEEACSKKNLALYNYHWDGTHENKPQPVTNILKLDTSKI